MSKQFLGLRTVIYHVPDLAKAKKWYAEAFDTQPYFDEPFYAGFNICGYELGLLPDEGDAKKKDESVITYWGVDDANMSFQRLIKLGATVHEEPTDVGSGIITASVKDLWGNIIGIIYNPHFSLE